VAGASRARPLSERLAPTRFEISLAPPPPHFLASSHLMLSWKDCHPSPVLIGWPAELSASRFIIKGRKQTGT
jgi:hypothetical protein